ncbi:MAG: hypothetical protein BWK79_10985 [Beggiatoa sp. IS2]|nr:MAG: hypothetical protein BWK79_10985 [Beggiatoa sp. IS2]
MAVEVPPAPAEKVSSSLVTITEAWVREVPPGVRMSAAYMTITNSTDHELVLVSVNSPEFGKVELHHTVVEDGVAKMIHQTQISIPAKQSVAFEPGGFHFMLLDSQQNIVAGNKVTLVLNFKEGQQSVVAEVKSALVNKPVPAQ